MSCTWFWSTCQTSTLWDSASSVLLQHSVAHHFPNDMTFPNHMTQGSGEVRSCFLAVWQVAHLTCTVGELCLFLYNKPAWLVCILVFSKLKGYLYPRRKIWYVAVYQSFDVAVAFVFQATNIFSVKTSLKKRLQYLAFSFLGLHECFFKNHSVRAHLRVC